MSPVFSSRFSDFSRRQAIFTLLIFAIGFSYALFVGFRNPDCTPPLDYPPEAIADPLYGNDSLFYRRIIQRVHDGEGYYDVANNELRQHGFKPDSIFNWRLPTYAWFFGSLPRPLYGQIMLSVLVIMALAMVYANERKDVSLPACMVSVALTYGVFHVIFSAPEPKLDTVPPVLFQETWACAFITVSVAAYGLGWRVVGVIAGISALFWRELALPYCVVAAFLALIRGQRKEAIAWGIGLSLFVWFFVSHSMEITKRLDANTAGASNVSRWIAFAGLRFHFIALNVNSWLGSFPGWAMAGYLGLSCIGLAGWRGKQSALVGLTATIYLIAFCIVGKTLNCYWGLMYATLLPYGIVRSPQSLWQLIQAAISPKRFLPPLSTQLVD